MSRLDPETGGVSWLSVLTLMSADCSLCYQNDFRALDVFGEVTEEVEMKLTGTEQVWSDAI